MKYNTVLLISFVALILLSGCKNEKGERSHQKTLTVQEEIKYIELGEEIVSNSFSTLSDHLQKAIKSGGISEGIKYCNIAAYPLTDSLSRVYDVQITRSSLKLRNSDNKPDDKEGKILHEFTEMKNSDQIITPKVEKYNDGSIFYFAPIYINDLCLKCHGDVGSQIDKKDYVAIKKYYPSDQAIGYQSGDLRGIWSIRFKK